MELTQKRIYEDIGEIKETIECSKRKFSGPYKLFLGYGILQGALLIFNLVGNIVLGLSSGNAYFNFATEAAVSVITIVLYLMVYKSERNTSNRYYLIAISIWGIIAVALPFLLFSARLAVAFCGNDSAVEMLQVLADYKMLANMVLVCVAIIMVGYITDKRWMLALSILTLFVFVITRVMPATGIAIPIKGNMEMEIALYSIVYYVFNVLGYIGLGLLLKHQEKKSGNI